MAEIIGFIGVGNIGNPMARRLIGAGYRVVAFDADREALARIVEAGAEAASSPRAVAARAEKICLSLPTSHVVEAVCFGPEGLAETATPGSVVIDLTSGNPPHSAEINARLREKDIDFLDAGVSGGLPGAEAGTLGIMTGGDEKRYLECLPIFHIIGQNVFHMGPSGAGHMTKALNNFCAAANYLALCEAVTVATKSGLDPTKVVEAINASSGKSFSSEIRFPRFVLSGDFTHAGGMATELMVKDVTTALGVGKEVDVPMPMAGLTQQLFNVAQAILGPKAPNQSAVRIYEQWAGVENRSRGPTIE